VSFVVISLIFVFDGQLLHPESVQVVYRLHNVRRKAKQSSHVRDHNDE
jgi:hypothetical protein